MSTSTQTTNLLKGGEWLVKDSNAFETYTPEDFNEEQKMVKEMCLQFLASEVLPIVDRIDKLEPGLMPGLMVKAGEQGLLGASIPEEFGGLGKDFITSTLVNEGLGGGYSFSVAVAAHTGIGTLPIFSAAPGLLFGIGGANTRVPLLSWSSVFFPRPKNNRTQMIAPKNATVLRPAIPFLNVLKETAANQLPASTAFAILFASLDSSKITVFKHAYGRTNSQSSKKASGRAAIALAMEKTELSKSVCCIKNELSLEKNYLRITRTPLTNLIDLFLR